MHDLVAFDRLQRHALHNDRLQELQVVVGLHVAVHDQLGERLEGSDIVALGVVEHVDEAPHPLPLELQLDVYQILRASLPEPDLVQRTAVLCR